MVQSLSLQVAPHGRLDLRNFIEVSFILLEVNRSDFKDCGTSQELLPHLLALRFHRSNSFACLYVVASLWVTCRFRVMLYAALRFTSTAHVLTPETL